MIIMISILGSNLKHLDEFYIKLYEVCQGFPGNSSYQKNWNQVY